MFLKNTMKNRRTLCCAPLVIVACFLLTSVYGGNTPVDDSVFRKTFSQKFDTIAIENTSGRTDIQTWNSNRVRVTASHQNARTSARDLDSRIRFQIDETDLRIIVRTGRSDEAVDLLVFVPRQVNLTVKGDADTIAIKGITNALTVESESGAISLAMPNEAESDLSVRSVEGTITSQIEMRVFGPVNAHILDGRTGRGGRPVILRSLRGSVLLAADEPGRIARADALVTDERISGSSDVTPGASRESLSLMADGERSKTNPGPSPTNRIDPSDPPVADVIRIDSRLVNLNVRVTDQTGKLIPDLNKKDFQIFEDNVEQDVVRFEPVTSPVNVVILLDASGSTHERWKVIKKAAKKFIDTLSPNTPIAVAAFTRRFMVICDFTCDRKTTKQRIDDTKNLQSGTAFYDAMWAALELFKEVKDQRKAIVVLTDGVDNSLSDEDYEPRHPFDELFTRIGREEVTIYPIYFDTEFQVVVKWRGSETHDSYVTARQQLNKIADETGGTLFKADRAEDLDGVYQRVASELQTLYSVSYNPADKNYNGNWRNVGVKVKREQAVARTKRGFYAK
jgi:VWFA-related protein